MRSRSSRTALSIGYTRVVFDRVYCNASKPRCKSALRSSTFSSPTAMRNRMGLMPANSRCSSVRRPCVVVAGCVMVLLVSPRLAVIESRRVLRMRGEPGIINVSDTRLFLQPFGKCLRRLTHRAHAQTQGFKPLGEIPRIEGAQGRAGGAQKREYLLAHQILVADHRAAGPTLSAFNAWNFTKGLETLS